MPRWCPVRSVRTVRDRARLGRRRRVPPRRRPRRRCVWRERAPLAAAARSRTPAAHAMPAACCAPVPRVRRPATPAAESEEMFAIWSPAPAWSVFNASEIRPAKIRASASCPRLSPRPRSDPDRHALPAGLGCQLDALVVSRRPRAALVAGSVSGMSIPWTPAYLSSRGRRGWGRLKGGGSLVRCSRAFLSSSRRTPSCPLRARALPVPSARRAGGRQAPPRSGRRGRPARSHCDPP